MNIKDTENILSHNIWTCGDLLSSFTDFTYYSGRGDIQLTKQNATNGDYCIKFNRTLPQGNTAYNMLQVSINPEEFKGKTLKFTADILNTTNTGIAIQLKTDKQVKWTEVPPNTTISTYSITHIIENDATIIQCVIAISSSANQEYVFTDNWNVHIQ